MAWTWASSRFPVLRVRTSAWAGPGKRLWQNPQSCQPIEQVLGHPPFFSSFTVECVSWYWESKYPRQNQSYFVFSLKYLVLPWGFWFCREVFCFCREVFCFAVTVVGHHSFVLSVAWSTEKKGKKQFCRALCTDLRDVRTDDVIVCDAHSQQNWQTTGGRYPRWLKKTYFWQLHQMRFGILFIQKTGIKRKLHRSVY